MIKPRLFYQELHFPGFVSKAIVASANLVFWVIQLRCYQLELGNRRYLESADLLKGF